jgi:SNF2 family DNA or RNA helicase
MDQLHLRQHQRENVAFLRGRQGAAILDEQGLGKSCSVIAYLEELQKSKGRPLRVLIACPATIMHTWAAEVRKFSTILEPCVIEGTKAKRLRLLRSEFDVGVTYIVNYEFVRALRGKHGKGPDNLSRFNPIWDVIVADEMTRLKTRTSATSRSFHDFVRNSPKTIRIGMTGTPITNSPLDAFSQYMFVDPAVFGTRYPEFESRYANTRLADFGNGSFRQVTGYRNLEDLTQRIHKVSIRHEKSKCTDLPAKTHQKIILEFDKEQSRVYQELKNDLIAESEGKVVTAANALARLSKLQQITSGFFYNVTNHDRKEAVRVGKKNPKTAALIDLVNDASGPVVVWCRFRACLDLVSDALNDAGISHGVFRSELTPEERGKMSDDFQAGKFRVIVAQTVIAQFGLTWTRASTAIFYSQSFSVEEMLQAQDRIHRIGQTNPCTYYYLTIKGSVDEACYGAVMSKSKIGRAIAGQDFKALAEGKVNE